MCGVLDCSVGGEETRRVRCKIIQYRFLHNRQQRAKIKKGKKKKTKKSRNEIRYYGMVDKKGEDKTPTGIVKKKRAALRVD